MSEASGWQREQVAVIECNLDDMTAEALGYALEGALQAGALDAWFTPIQMKKSRPAVLFSVLCRVADVERLADWLLRETTTLGVRWRLFERLTAERAVDEVVTPWGAVRRKLKLIDGRVAAAKPEYDDCARLAREQHVPLHEILDAVRRAPLTPVAEKDS